MGRADWRCGATARSYFLASSALSASSQNTRARPVFSWCRRRMAGPVVGLVGQGQVGGQVFQQPFAVMALGLASYELETTDY